MLCFFCFSFFFVFVHILLNNSKHSIEMDDLNKYELDRMSIWHHIKVRNRWHSNLVIFLIWMACHMLLFIIFFRWCLCPLYQAILINKLTAKGATEFFFRVLFRMNWREEKEKNKSQIIAQPTHTCITINGFMIIAKQK